MKKFVAAALLCGIATSLYAAMPRWAKTGNDSRPMRWYRDDVSYFVDAGPLSAYVSHDAAVTIVDAAAAVWNVPSASLTIKRGGTLNEDVSDANVYLGVKGPIWPDDVQPENYAAKNIAIIFDTDGSITDMLLGSGASAPVNCRNAAVTESVDQMDATGLLQHALLILNGRCTGPAPEQQLQMQYQLMRAFGRILGIGWSQTNDNVFTGSPAPTYSQQQNWPIMHPIDIICGVYTYQCLVNPFQLRPDDVAAVGIVYPITSNPPTGKVLTLQNGNAVSGTVLFPNGMGMSGVNMVVHVDKPSIAQYDDFESVSAVSGYLVRSENGNPVTGAVPAGQLNGGQIRALAGLYLLSGIPVPSGMGWTNLHLTAQALNPLYVGAYSVGPYRTATVVPSGEMKEQVFTGVGRGGTVRTSVYPATQASDCSSGEDGSETSPAVVDATGWWTGRLCGYGHTAWMNAAAKKGHTLTIEVTALDESGNASNNKALPLIGVWSASDAIGILPTITATPKALNGRLVGLTQLPVSFTSDRQLRIAITEQRGEGRPDFSYRARVLYADSISPERIPVAGGRIVIHGMGFQTGNAVTIGGLLATVESLSSTQIVATAPPLPSNASTPYTADVAVTDLKTGGSTKITTALSYGGKATDLLQVISAPSGNVPANTALPVPFSVRLTDSSRTPIRSASITFTASAGDAGFGCGVSPCSVLTDEDGIAQTVVVAGNAGKVTLSAGNGSGVTVAANFNIITQPHTVTPLRSVQLVAAGETYTWQPQVALRVDGRVAASTSVTWTSPDNKLKSLATISNAQGIASAQFAYRLTAGEQVAITACAWTSACATMQQRGVASEDWRLIAVSGDMQSVSASDTLTRVTVQVIDKDSNPIAAAPVMVYQRAEGWQPPCNPSGRCATAPMYGSSAKNLVSDADGFITFDPLQYASTATQTHVTVTAGSAGLANFTLEKHP